MHLANPMIVGAKIRLSQNNGWFFSFSGSNKWSKCTVMTSGTLYKSSIFLNKKHYQMPLNTHITLPSLNDCIIKMLNQTGSAIIQPIKFSSASNPSVLQKQFSLTEPAAQTEHSFCFALQSCFPGRLWSLPSNVLSCHLTKIPCYSWLPFASFFFYQ